MSWKTARSCFSESRNRRASLAALLMEECSGRDLNPGPRLERPLYFVPLHVMLQGLTGLYYRSSIPLCWRCVVSMAVYSCFVFLTAAGKFKSAFASFFSPEFPTVFPYLLFSKHVSRVCRLFASSFFQALSRVHTCRKCALWL